MCRGGETGSDCAWGDSERSPLGLSLSGSAGGRGDAKTALPWLLHVLGVRVHTRVCAWMCTGVGHRPCRGGPGCTPPGAQPPAESWAASPWPPYPAAFQPAPGAERRASRGKVGLAGILWHWGPPVPLPAPTQLPWPAVHLPRSLLHQSWLQIHPSHPILAHPPSPCYTASPPAPSTEVS